jgi:anaerobic magnesium-protoporphyrin IX monomethyl ester cyclase
MVIGNRNLKDRLFHPGSAVKKKILLCSMPFSAHSPDPGPRYENLGLCYLLGYLKARGYEGEIYDGNAVGTSFDRFLSSRSLDSYILIGFSVYSTNYLATIDAVRKLRGLGFNGHITLGGHYPSFSAKEILEKHPEIDSIAVGEGEEVLCLLLERLTGGGGLQGLPGLALSNEGSIEFGPPSCLLTSLDFSFSPDRTFYEPLLKAQNFATLSSSRGCWGSCSFCSVRNFYRLSEGASWRNRSPAHVVDELEDLNRRLGITSFAFFDDNFIGPGSIGKGRAREIAEEIVNRKLEIAFSIECRPDDLEEELVGRLRAAGLVKVSMGIESFLPRQQEIYGKTLDGETVKKALSTLRKQELLYSLYLILFDPFTTFDELLENFRHVGFIGAQHFHRFSGFLQVFPGIPLYEKLQQEGLLGDYRISATEQNEYWIQYKFKDERMAIFLAAWISFEERIGFLFSRHVPELGDEGAFEAYGELRRLTYQCLLGSLEKGREKSERSELVVLLANLTEDYYRRAEDLLKGGL